MKTRLHRRNRTGLLNSAGILAGVTWLVSLLVVMVIAFSVALTACSSGAQSSETRSDASTPGTASLADPFPLSHLSRESAFADALPESPGYRMATEPSTYEVSTDRIKLIISNDTGSEVRFGMPYALEVRRDDGWHTVPFRQSAAGSLRAWLAWAMIVLPGGEKAQVIELAEHAPLEPGQYRVVKEVFQQSNRTDLPISEQTTLVWCAFSVQAPAG